MERIGLKEKFSPDPAVQEMNHGSFGACPKEVTAAFYGWAERSERQPGLFYMREYHDLMKTARAALARYLGTGADRLVYIPNATHGGNLIARLRPAGDRRASLGLGRAGVENLPVRSVRGRDSGDPLERAELRPYFDTGL